MATVVARYPSNSNPSIQHEVRQGDDGVLYCTCPGWRLHAKEPRTCKHLEHFRSSTMLAQPKPTQAGSMQNSRAHVPTHIEVVTADVIRILKGEK